MGPIGVGSDLQTLHCLFRTTFSLRCPCIELRPPVLTPYPLATIPIIAFETNHEGSSVDLSYDLLRDHLSTL